MAEEPGHKAMLYFLEVLMNSNGPLTISQLAGRFGSRNFTSEMRMAAGGNEVGLKKFLLKYPSLFTVTGNMVSLFDSSKAAPSLGSKDTDSSNPGPTRRSLPDVSAEMDAVQFFQMKMSKKEEHWVPVKSLAGHLSQANENVRNCVGPQLDFGKWLLRHPHIFEVQGELVGIRDGLAAVATPTLIRRFNFDGVKSNGEPSSPSRNVVPPKTPPPMRRAPPKTPPAMRRSKSFSDKRTDFNDMVASSQAPVMRRRGAPVTMTANEYKAVMFLKNIIEQRGAIKLHNITGHFSQAHEGVRNTIGWTKMELEEFIRRNGTMFSLSQDEYVSVVKNAKLNVVITGSRPQSQVGGQGTRTLNGRKGKIFHVAKLWGIIDLGKHEHVFFDKSIMRKHIDDLQKDYKVGETLYFNAVLAMKTSRAKWRATHVWAENEMALAAFSDSDLSSSSDTEKPRMSQYEDEINQFLPEDDRSSTHSHERFDSSGEFSSPRDSRDLNRLSIGSSSDLRVDAPEFRPGMYLQITTGPGPDGGDLTPTNNNNQVEKNLGNEKVVPTQAAQVNGASPPQSKIEAKSSPKSSPKPSVVSVGAAETKIGAQGKKTFKDMGCQTVSTGEIIATQLHHDE